MPLRGDNHSDLVFDPPRYFESLLQLDRWLQNPKRKLNGVLPYTPRSHIQAYHSPAGLRGKLLACEDYKGGYTDPPSGLQYNFSFWSLCDTWIHFAYYRVTIPPPGWVNSAHRQGVPILGTLIFEGGSGEECLRLVVGPVSDATTGPAESATNTTMPVSSHYAKALALLAHLRGFDGYLMHVETPLTRGQEQSQALTAWMALLQLELQLLIGNHAQVVWYDCVTLDGSMSYQNRLNDQNLPFFLPTSGFLSNYWWNSNYPQDTASYFTTINPAQLTQPRKTLTVQNVNMGLDVWGRGYCGGGGLDSYKALQVINPQELGLSVALFAQGWTWETLQEWTFIKWWEREQSLWVGLGGNDQFPPISSFFLLSPPPNPSNSPLVATFCQGIGYNWFVGSYRVLETVKGWTDFDKNSSIGDLLWPHPKVVWEDERPNPPTATVTPSLCTDDGWLGGGSVSLIVKVAGCTVTSPYHLWVPIQSLALTSRKPYALEVTYKPLGSTPLPKIRLSARPLIPIDEVAANASAIQENSSVTDLPNGWKKLTIQFSMTEAFQTDIPTAAGMIFELTPDELKQPIEFSLLLGMLIATNAPSTPPEPDPRILWVKFDQATAEPRLPFSGTLTWETGFSYPFSVSNDTSTGCTEPAWLVNPKRPTFLYHNIYVFAHAANDVALHPANATFIGTTGFSGHANSFYIDPACLPMEIQAATGVRFYVQGITDQGKIMTWDHCSFVDI